MKRRFQIRLSTLLVVFLSVGAILAAYTHRTKSLENFRQIEDRLSDFLAQGLDQRLAGSDKLSRQQSLTPVIDGVSGGHTSYGALFRESNFEKTYCDKIRFRRPDGTEQWPDGYNVSIRIVGRLGIFSSCPTIEIVSLDGQYSSVATACVQEFIEEELKIVPFSLGNPQR